MPRDYCHRGYTLIALIFEQDDQADFRVGSCKSTFSHVPAMHLGESVIGVVGSAVTNFERANSSLGVRSSEWNDRVKTSN